MERLTRALTHKNAVSRPGGADRILRSDAWGLEKKWKPHYCSLEIIRGIKLPSWNETNYRQGFKNRLARPFLAALCQAVMKARMWKAKGYSCDLCHIHCSGMVCFCPSRLAALTGGGEKKSAFQPIFQSACASVSQCKKAVWCSLIRFGNCVLEQCIARLPFSLFLNRLLGRFFFCFVLFWPKRKHQSCELTQTHNEVFWKQKRFSAEEALSSFPRSTDI